MSSSFYEMDSIVSGNSFHDEKQLSDLQEIATETAIEIFNEYFAS